MPTPAPKRVDIPAGSLDGRLFMHLELVGIGLMSAAVYYTEADGSTNVWQFQKFDNRKKGPYLIRLGSDVNETARKQHLRRCLIIVKLRNPDTRPVHFTVKLRLGIYKGTGHTFFIEIPVFDAQLLPQSDRNVSEELQFWVP